MRAGTCVAFTVDTMPDTPPDVEIIADPRLEALWGQSLVVGEHTIDLPDFDEPFAVPAVVAEVLLKQPGWRQAPLRIVGEPPQPAFVPLPSIVPLPVAADDATSPFKQRKGRAEALVREPKNGNT